MRTTFIVLGVIMAFIGWLSAFFVLRDDSLSSVARAALFVHLAFITGTLIALWLARISIKVKVDDAKLTVGLWPVSQTSVRFDTIRKMDLVNVDPVSDYGGWGIKGPKNDKFYGLSGNDGLKVLYGKGRALTILLEDPGSLKEIVEAKMVSDQT